LSDELADASDRIARGDKTALLVERQAQKKRQQARNAVTRKKIELETLRQDLEWAKDFTKQHLLENQPRPSGDAQESLEEVGLTPQRQRPGAEVKNAVEAPDIATETETLEPARR